MKIAKLVVGLLPACAQDQARHEDMHHAGGMAAVTTAVAVIHNTLNNRCAGVVHFTQTAEGLRVVADLEDLAPNTTHAFHIHEFGDCTAADAMSAGGHFDPEHTGHHGSPADPHRHAGDLGNVTDDSEGKVHLDIIRPDLTINGHDAVLGRSVIVHAQPDDFATQPTGNAGGRIGCGVIGIAKPTAVVASRS